MLILFIAVLALCIFIGLQLYFLIRRCHHLLLFSSYAAAAATNATLPTKGLSPSVLQSLPTFHYSAAYEDDPLECSVCLSEFQENEMGRILPNCNHAFHVECIDMWFLSHSNCPLCRLPIQLPHNPAHTIINVGEPAASLNPTCYRNQLH